MTSVSPSVVRVLSALLIGLRTVPAFAEDAFAIKLGNWLTSELVHPVNPAGSGVNRDALTLSYQRGDASLVREFTYAYEQVLLRAGDPATNGHLHRFGVRSGFNLNRLEFEVEAGLHGSSNRFKRGDLDGETVVLQFEMQYRLGSDNTVGVYGDYRFGGFQVYPGFKWAFLLAEFGEIELDLPRSGRWHSRERRWTVGIERYGQKWSTLDRAQETASRYYLDEWRVSAGFNASYQRIPWGASIGMSFDTDIRYLDLIEGPSIVTLEPGVFIELYLTL